MKQAKKARATPKPPKPEIVLGDVWRQADVLNKTGRQWIRGVNSKFPPKK